MKGSPIAFLQAGLAFVLVLSGSSASTRAQDNSPEGRWDCVISGTRSGLAYLVFSANTNGGTFEGFSIIVPKTETSPRTSLISGMVAGLGSNGLGPRPGQNQSGTNLSIFGSGPVTGPWAFDNKGRIVGSFVESTDQICVTETNFLQSCVDTNVPYAVTNKDGSLAFDTSTNFHFCFTSGSLETNVTWSATNSDGTLTNFYTAAFSFNNTNFTVAISCSAISNVVNFVGKVVPGKRLVLTSRGTLGRFIVRGVPAVALSDISGSWLGTKKQNRISTLELFTLTTQTNVLASVTNLPNSYVVDGAGPGYIYTNGLAILSAQEKIALAFDLFSGGEYQSTRAIIGSFNSGKLKANTSGIDAASGIGAGTNRVTFQIQKRATVP